MPAHDICPGSHQPPTGEIVGDGRYEQYASCSSCGWTEPVIDGKVCAHGVWSPEEQAKAAAAHKARQAAAHAIVNVHPCNDAWTDQSGPCKGPVCKYWSRSGATSTYRCEAHQDAYNVRMDKVERGLQQRYPGYDNPHSSPPDWFDPLDAGEEW